MLPTMSARNGGLLLIIGTFLQKAFFECPSKGVGGKQAVPARPRQLKKCGSAAP
jgi:hypothetical protein